MKVSRRISVLSTAGLLLVGSSLGRAAATIPCADGLELSLSTQEPSQGGVVLIEVKSTRLAEIKASWAGQNLHFWYESKPEKAYRALLGVDLRRKARQHPLTVEAKLEDGERVGCSANISIRDGQFAVQHLTVENKFVELSSNDLARSRRETQLLKKIFRAVTSARLWDGGFQAPLQGVEASGSFGKRRILNDQPRSPHSGEDFSAPSGTPVRAPQRGRVVLAEDLFFTGNSVVIDHGLGLYTFYGHLESMAVRIGNVVEAGDLLGGVGATGRVTGPHLHWAARLNNARVNPLSLIAVLPRGTPPTE
jgi:murein DD-endopeptidase MepM/ murein hydrolase activator NlpD